MKGVVENIIYNRQYNRGNDFGPPFSIFVFRNFLKGVIENIIHNRRR